MNNMSLFKVVEKQIKKIFVSRFDYDMNAVDVWGKLFQTHGEDWDSSSLEECLKGVYIKSGATTLQEFQDYIKIQLTFQ